MKQYGPTQNTISLGVSILEFIYNLYVI